MRVLIGGYPMNISMPWMHARHPVKRHKYRIEEALESMDMANPEDVKELARFIAREAAWMLREAKADPELPEPPRFRIIRG